MGAALGGTVQICVEVATLTHSRSYDLLLFSLTLNVDQGISPGALRRLLVITARFEVVLTFG